ncbi:hypothetical protein MNBD_GAMMA08-809 [hydrothermal vent metagenome]|uniref:Outer membrane protein beta-barrel domain-containing protein n=1 Tax=hydrothermal vent metagenome TaxID=652676 RepID=A0A3B0X5P1_9ZZZZ
MNKILLVLLLFASSAHAESGLDFVLSGGLTSGGDTLASTTTGGSLKSGGLFLISAGGLYSFEDSNFQLQATLGYHFDELSADNGSADFKRTTFELIPYYKITESMRLGLGYTYITSINYSDPLDTINFKDANGFIAEINWRMGSKSWWGFRYADIEYIADSINGFNIGQFGIPFDGSYAGLMFHGVF